MPIQKPTFAKGRLVNSGSSLRQAGSGQLPTFEAPNRSLGSRHSRYCTSARQCLGRPTPIGYLHTSGGLGGWKMVCMHTNPIVFARVS